MRPRHAGAPLAVGPGPGALAGLRAEVLVALALLALVLVDVSLRGPLPGDVGPGPVGVLPVQLRPLLGLGLGVGQDGLGRALGLAHAAVDALVGVDDEHVVALVETVDRADLDAIHVLAPDAGLGDYVGHDALHGAPTAAGCAAPTKDICFIDLIRRIARRVKDGGRDAVAGPWGGWSPCASPSGPITRSAC